MNLTLGTRYSSLLLATAFLVASSSCDSSQDYPIAFVSTVGGDAEVLLLDVETRESTPLTENQIRDFDPRISPDRKVLAYVSEESGDLEINLVDLDERSILRLTYAAGDDVSPRWSPDGKRLSFISNRDDQPEVYVMNADGTNPTRITSNSYEDRMGGWSPDGEWLVFHSVGSEETQGLWLRNPDGVNSIHLTSGQDSEPVWSPNGEHIALSRMEGENSDIYIVSKSEGGTWHNSIELTRLTRHPASDLSPDWSPDSKGIVFTSFRDDSAEIYSMLKDGSKQLRLTNNLEVDQDPAWSPDGKRIAFVSHVYGAGEIIVMDSNGENQRRLTNNKDQDESPRW